MNLAAAIMPQWWMPEVQKQDWIVILMIPGLNMVLGAAVQTGKNNYSYVDVERSAGSDYKKDWQWNVGARWSF